MKKSILFFIAVMSFVFSQQTNAQITFQIGGGGGYAIPAGDLGGDITSMDDDNFGMDGGLNFHAKARVGVLNFIAVGEIGYTMLGNDGNFGPVSYENNMNIFSMKVGPEFHLGLPLIPIDPYFGATFQINSFSGDTELTGGGAGSLKYDWETATRYGFGVNGGVIISAGSLKIDFNLGYNMLNAFGKEFNEDDTSGIFLNDGEGNGSDSKALNTIELKATLMFGI